MPSSSSAASTSTALCWRCFYKVNRGALDLSSTAVTLGLGKRSDPSISLNGWRRQTLNLMPLLLCCLHHLVYVYLHLSIGPVGLYRCYRANHRPDRHRGVNRVSAPGHYLRPFVLYVGVVDKIIKMEITVTFFGYCWTPKGLFSSSNNTSELNEFSRKNWRSLDWVDGAPSPPLSSSKDHPSPNEWLWSSSNKSELIFGQKTQASSVRPSTCPWTTIRSLRWKAVITRLI